MTRVGTIAELWRYPVKSMGGERIDVARLDRKGLVGDRLWALRDTASGEITGGKRIPGIMGLDARYRSEPDGGGIPAVDVTLPDGARVASDDANVHGRLTEFLGRAVTLEALRPASDAAHFRGAKGEEAMGLRRSMGVGSDEPLPDLSVFPARMLAELARYATPRGAYYDAYPIHLLTTASLAAIRALAPETDFDTRRFRPNLLIETTPEVEGLAEIAWCPGTLRVGDAVLRIDIPTVRCSMPARPQRGLAAEPQVMKTIAREAERRLGAYATVARPGAVRVGDAVHFEPDRRSALRKRADAGVAAAKRVAFRVATRLMGE